MTDIDYRNPSCAQSLRDKIDWLARDFRQNLGSPPTFSATMATTALFYPDLQKLADDPFLKAIPDIIGPPTSKGRRLSPRFVERQIALAAMLYEVADQAWAAELCHRFSKQTFRSVYYEAHAMAFMRKMGFALSFVPTTGVRGNDFEFSAKMGDCIAFVEVSASELETFSKSNVYNKLKKKKSRLPTSGAGIIIIALPENTDVIADPIRSELAETCQSFFTTAPNVRYVFFLHEIVDQSDNQSIRVGLTRFINPSASERIADLDGAVESFTTPRMSHQRDQYFTEGYRLFTLIEELEGITPVAPTSSGD